MKSTSTLFPKMFRQYQLVPILVNAIPVPLATDSYIIAITLSFLIHQYAPIMHDVLKQSAYLHTLVICLYECMRAAVVVKLTTLAGNKYCTIGIFDCYFWTHHVW
jgi:hypothetical protein